MCNAHYKQLIYYPKNKERCRKTCQKYNEKNKAKVYADQQRWKRDNWDYYKSYLATQKRRVKRATPPWMPKETIIAAFKACPEGMEVDHIVPLQGKLVSGLNVPWNFQYLPSHENNSKNNKFDGTYENESWRKDLVDSKLKQK